MSRETANETIKIVFDCQDEREVDDYEGGEIGDEDTEEHRGEYTTLKDSRRSGAESDSGCNAFRRWEVDTGVSVE